MEFFWSHIREDLGKLTKKVSNCCINIMSDHTWSIVNRLGHPYLVKNIECLEKIQRRATKMGRGLDDVCCDKRRLKVLGLLSHEH